MSVPASQRYTSTVQYLKTVKDVTKAVHKIYRKLNAHYKQDLGRWLCDLARSAEINANKVNSVYANNLHKMKMKQEYLTEAIASTKALLTEVDDLYDNEIKHDITNSFGQTIHAVDPLVKPGLIAEVIKQAEKSLAMLLGVQKKLDKQWKEQPES